jgi:hypothetical protein
VLSETETPVASGSTATLDQVNGANYTKAVLDAQNNYWTLNFNTGLVLDKKSDLNLGYTYYRADNYTDYEPVAASFGSGAEEHGITATVVRRISERVRLTVRYGYYHSEDELSGGNNDYEAHVLFSSLQYRF